jgi:hypothetical protein
MVFTVPDCRGMNCAIRSGTVPASFSPLLCATPAIRRGGPVAPLKSNPKPVTTGAFLIASAKTSSLSGNFSARRRISRVCSSSGRVRTTRSIEERSGSAKITSKAMTAAPFSVSFRTSVASTVRGQGHCPCSASAASSMSTMRTGMSSGGTRGLSRW